MVDRLRMSQANRQRIENIDQCFAPQGQTLWAEGRVLVGEGVLMKMCRKKAKPRQFFLFNDLLVYGSILISKRRYHKQRIIPLEQVKLDDLKDDGNVKHGWNIMARGKSFTVYAATETEKQEWMLHINRCVTDLYKHGKRPSLDLAAVWVPDSDASECMCCKSSTFTLINRRHHCRSCGHVICGNCSTNRFVLPGINKRPVRVCDDCYKKLAAGDHSVVQPEVMKNEVSTHFETDESEDDDNDDRTQSSDEMGTTFYGSGPTTRAPTAL
uniref:Pleckstrin homology domain-containing family F member 2 n=1 Tax=Panagrolaimus sp. JU765 TaxID=591449 RepID=A0AC34QKD8_9BILA